MIRHDRANAFYMAIGRSRTGLSRITRATVSGAVLPLWLAASPVWAQTGAPITVTPPSLAPQQRENRFRVEVPEGGALEAPVGAEALAVTPGEIIIEGSFAEVSPATNAVIAALRGRRISLREIYAAASAIEAAHVRAGYVLARVSIPAQDLRDGGVLRIIVTDGFIEAVDVSGLPERVRASVLARAGKLTGRRHLRLADIEQPLTIASDVPGLTLRSTLMRGKQAGGTKLLLEGSHQLVSGRVGADNALDPSLGTYEFSAQVSLNSALGLGEQIYGFAALGYDVSKLASSDAPVRVLGGGLTLPLGNGRLALNPEATYSRTRPAPAAGAPQTVGTLRRLTLRGNYTLVRARTRQSSLSITLEQIDEASVLPDFATMLSHDRYSVLRLGASWLLKTGSRSQSSASLQVSRGLGNLGAISAADALATGTPFSRQGVSTNFSRLSASGRASWQLGSSANLSVSARGQSTFGDAVFRSEQFSLEGTDGLSAYVGGTTAVDEGLIGRVELATEAHVGSKAWGLRLLPYLFAAAGTGRIDAPTALEPASISAASFGAGLRADLGNSGLSLSAEYAHGLSGYRPLADANRLNVGVGLSF